MRMLEKCRNNKHNNNDSEYPLKSRRTNEGKNRPDVNQEENFLQLLRCLY